MRKTDGWRESGKSVRAAQHDDDDDDINLYYGNQMHNNYKLDEQAITNIIKRHIKPIEKQIKLIIYDTKFKTPNLIVKNSENTPKPN